MNSSILAVLKQSRFKGNSMETLLVILIVGLAALYIIRNFYKKFNKAKVNSCDCGCSSCDIASTSCDPVKEEKHCSDIVKSLSS